MKSNNKISLQDIEKVLPLKTWYASIFVLPVSKIFILFFSNYRILTPNQITFIATVFRLITAIMFLKGFFAVGAVFYYFAYVLDCVDGAVARLTNQTSAFGRYLDHVSDLVGDIVVLCSLAFSQGLLFSYTLFGMVFMHIAESYISYLMSFICLEKKDNALSGFIGLFERYRQFWFKRNFKSFFSFPDYAAFVFILMPILGAPKKGIEYGFFFLFIVVCYTIFSTFISLHTGNKKFP